MQTLIETLDVFFTDYLPDILSICPGCVDGLVGVAARVAWAQTPWLSVGEEASPNLTNHIAGLESMLLEMQLRVR